MVTCCYRLLDIVYVWWMFDWNTFSSWMSIFLSFFFLISELCLKELRICPGVGARKCGAFLARLDRDPHPTCTRCRGKVCTKDMTCDFCAVWSAEQWDLFAKKRSYKERKHRPSGSAPSAQQTSPAAGNFFGSFAPWGLLLLLLPAL